MSIESYHSNSFNQRKSSMHRSRRPTPLTTATYWPTSLWLSKTLEPPLTTPPLSPSTTEIRSYRKRYEEEDDDDDEPLLSLLSPISKSKMSLLSDDEEEGDDELIPIARLNRTPVLLSAAEKYKAKVKAQLQLDH
ncbi:hypothetical protein BY458DRAFT_507358 [Sporodiniella umbellata]|nr:hypothetical protein BY458DRAFT_507358 [Sporodiniella umbellata]